MSVLWVADPERLFHGAAAAGRGRHLPGARHTTGPLRRLPSSDRPRRSRRLPRLLPPLHPQTQGLSVLPVRFYFPWQEPVGVLTASEKTMRTLALHLLKSNVKKEKGKKKGKGISVSQTRNIVWPQIQLQVHCMSSSMFPLTVLILILSFLSPEVIIKQ